jgi:hypothetical protein
MQEARYFPNRSNSSYFLVACGSPASVSLAASEGLTVLRGRIFFLQGQVVLGIDLDIRFSGSVEWINTVPVTDLMKNSVLSCDISIAV